MGCPVIDSSRYAGQKRPGYSCALGLALIALCLCACNAAPTLPPAQAPSDRPTAEYLIGPGDMLSIFVWRNPELSVELPVRPDGRISLPLVGDIVAIGKTTVALGEEIEQRLSKYVESPSVTVMARAFTGPFAQQIRVIGEAVTPKALPYRANMTVLDAIIEVGGLTRYAAGNRATIVRTTNSSREVYSVHLDDLIKDGNIDDNVALLPGDILIIPQRYF